MQTQTILEQTVSQVRRDILRMVHKVNSGHPGGSLGCTEFLVSLYNEVMDLKEGFDMNGETKMYSSFLTVIFLLFFIVFWHIKDPFQLKNLAPLD